MFKFRNLLHFTVIFAALCHLTVNIPYLYDFLVKFSVFIILLRFSEFILELTRPLVRVRLPSAKRAVLITGCDSGFGHLLAKRLDEVGYHVFAGCLSILSEGAKELQSTCSDRLKVIEIDVTSDDSVQKASQAVSCHIKDNDLWAVVNNAGIVQTGEFDWLSLDDINKVYEVNTKGVLRVVKTFLPLVKKSKGRIVNVCSYASRHTVPTCMGYSMSKRAAAAFTESLRMEMAKWGVDVIGIEPYFYKTSLTRAENISSGLDNQWRKAPEHIRQLYGKEYFSRFERLCQIASVISSDAVGDVLDCLEDAVTCRDPLNVYCPSYLPHKIMNSVAAALPQACLLMVGEFMMSYAKPLALSSSQNNMHKKVDMSIHESYVSQVNSSDDMKNKTS